MKPQLKPTKNSKIFSTLILLSFAVILPISLFSQDTQNALSIIGYFAKTKTSFKVKYNVEAEGVLSQGVCYGKTDNLNLSGNHITINQHKVTDTIEISGLSQATKYYCAAFAITATDTLYSVAILTYTLTNEPTDNCDNANIITLDSVSVSISFTKPSGASHVLAIIVEGSTPVDTSLIIDGEPVNELTIECVYKQLLTKNSFNSGNKLTPNTTYTLSLFSANLSVRTPYVVNYLTTGDIETLTFTTPKVTPTIQTSQINAQIKTDSSAEISWVNGNGEGRVVFINNVNVFTAPTKGQFPTTVNTYYSGVGQQAVYLNSGSSVEVAGLRRDSVYYVRAFEFNELGTDNPAYCNLTAIKNPYSFILPYERPQIQDSNIVFTLVTSNQIDLSWTKGDGASRIVVMNTSNSFTTPVDFTEYDYDDFWNDNGEQVIYNGLGNNTSVYGLSCGTKYYFRIYSYNNQKQFPTFNTSTAFNNPNSIATLGTAPQNQDYDIEFSDVTETSATISWKRGSGSFSLVLMSKTGNYSNPINGNTYSTDTVWRNNGNQYLYTGNKTSVTVTGLSLGNTYYFRVFAYNYSLNPTYKLSTADGNPAELRLGGVNHWDGELSNNWFAGKNWSLKYVPFNGNDVYIGETTHYPVLTNNTTIKNLTISSSGQLSIAQEVTLTVNGNLTLKGDSEGSGSLVLEEESNMSVSGTSSLTRNTGRTDEWHIASIPNNNKNINQFNGYYINSWNENNQWTQLTSKDSVNKMRGYSIKSYNRDTIRFVGKFNNGPQSINVTNSNIGNEDYGWNMVGNPYPSAIDWNNSDGWDREYINKTVYKYDIGYGDYATYNYETGVGVPESTNGIIPAGNGFFVLSDVASTNLGINNKARVHSREPYLKHGTDGSDKILRISITDGFSTDETAILFHPKALNEINPDIDAFKLPSLNESKVQIYSICGHQNRKMTLSSINEDLLNKLQPGEFIEKTIGFKNNGTQTSKLFINKNTLYNDFDVYLYNKLTNKYHNLEQPYHLLREDDDMTGAFSLRIMRKGETVNLGQQLINGIDVYASNNYIYVNSIEPITGTISVYDITGKIIYFEQLNSVSSHIIKNKNKSGMFVVLINSNQIKYSKLVFVE